MFQVPASKYLWLGFLAAFCVAIALSVIGDRALPLFGGDRSAAARAYIVAYLLLGGIMLSFLAPLVIQGLFWRMRAIIQSNGSEGWVADLVLYPGAPKLIGEISAVLMVLFGLMSVGAALWQAFFGRS